MDLEKLAANIRETYSLYGNAGLQILQADETFKVKVELNPQTENHVQMMHAASFVCRWGISWWPGADAPSRQA